MSAPLPIAKVHHIARTTRQVEVSRRFYKDVLGFREILRPNFDFRGAWLFGYGVQIHIIEHANAPTPEGPIDSRADHLALETDDPEMSEARLKEFGISYRVNIQQSTGLKQLFFKDPDGHHVEVAAYSPQPPFAD